MTPELSAEILRRFEAGESTLEVGFSLSPSLPLRMSRQEQAVLRAELARRQERIEELERELKEANGIIAMDRGE
mgnify:CR=1 FL=1